MSSSLAFFPRLLSLSLITTGLLVLGGIASRPAAAQDLVYQLVGVTFNDGAVASGYFDYNPANNTFGNYDIVTTNGVTDSLIGATYTPGFYTPQEIGPGSYNIFQFISNDGKYNFLSLGTEFNSPATAPGVFLIQPGVSEAGYFAGSGEFTPLNAAGTNRVITAGLFSVSAAVPEASTTVSFGLLLALGVGGAVIATRKKASNAA